MTTKSLQLEPVTLEDIPDITNLWYGAFTEPAMLHIWPDTPGVRQWWDNANRKDLLHKPHQRYIKIVDTKSVDAKGRPRIAAFAKWDLAMPEERGRRWPPWHGDMPRQDCDDFLAGLESERKRVMGDVKHYCTSFSGYIHRGWGPAQRLIVSRLGYAWYTSHVQAAWSWRDACEMGV